MFLIWNAVTNTPFDSFEDQKNSFKDLKWQTKHSEMQWLHNLLLHLLMSSLEHKHIMALIHYSAADILPSQDYCYIYSLLHFFYHPRGSVIFTPSWGVLLEPKDRGQFLRQAEDIELGNWLIGSWLGHRTGMSNVRWCKHESLDSKLDPVL